MNLKSFLSSPRFKGNAEKTQQAIVLNASLWSIIALLVLMIIGNYLGGQTPLLVNTLNFSFVAICFGIRFILHRGWLKTVTGILIFIGTIYITFLIITLGTIRTPATMAYVMAVIFTGLQFGKKGVFLATTLISCIIGGLILAEQNSLLAKPDFTVGITQWISYTLQLGFTGILTLLALNITQRNLQRAEQEIEKRKRVEKTLKTLSYAIDHNPASIIITGPNGEIQEVNPKFEQLTGYTIDEVRGKNLRLLQSGTHSKEFYKNLWGTITSGKEWFGEFHNKKKNGELYWEKASISPVLDENKRNFPSKIITYLQYGKPVISSETEGLSPKYREILYFFDPDSNGSIESSLLDLISLKKDDLEIYRQKIISFTKMNNTQKMIKDFNKFLESMVDDKC